MNGKRILVTGASGGMGVPLASYLAKNNDVVSLARFSRPEARAELEAAGVTTLTFDLASDNYDDIATNFDVVFHAGAILPPESESNWKLAFKVNTDSTGRLMSHLRKASFVICSSGSAYEYQSQRPLNEDDPFGLHIHHYSLTKVAAESVATFCAREWSIPTTIIRIFSLYSEVDGAPTRRVEKIAAGEEIPLHPDRPNNYNPMFVTDYCELSERAAEIASTPPLVVNFSGSETMPAEDYCTYAAELMGTEAKLVYTDAAYWPLWADTTRMHELLGPTKVGVKEGIRRIVEARFPERLALGTATP